ncbi:sulfur carrier protein ThiS [Sinorhizobium meliloti]|uniref:Sulfur carrier protein ThiS n=3 Tax=Sinorhizobium TaxID=28105 RepID=I2E1D0_RHIML|nr:MULTISPECIES: sulfur carrier protein ThiS [Sinorhizobium]AEG06515.1 thiamine biosynthesis protein ThiS [Sinorhizobium meliloti BL225C]AEG57211.1 thiamine biosynthesis protein ThiS [Sinorhizobium meliloti AK83]AEH81256.1 thiamine biosynthesis protein ThiS [Sinorhizobium meliloti SM11]AFJ91298.1 thiamine biosynthesis sulfur carrier protein [Sinorhizobium meliloti]AGA08553.1 thiamine biosynthesis protein ThiS [Sinorhizobium meliloti GR4]
MKLIVNGEALDVAAETLSELLVLMEYEGDWLATAINDELVHREDRFDRSLNDNDKIEILSPMQGG